MGTGGTLPSEIVQTVSLYNTTGIIEKDKRIYFCPLIYNDGSIANQRICDIWLENFNNAVGLQPSDYTNITISTWSPQDRVLTIKGNVDDFRCVTNYGRNFSYLILTRNPTTNNVGNFYYYPFFITGARQVGNGAVRLELELDTFTLNFYLKNHVNVGAYGYGYFDPFNNVINNAHVRKQHYNRYVLENGHLKETNLPIFSQIEESFRYKRQLRDYRTPLNYGNIFTEEDYDTISHTATFNSLSSVLKRKCIEASIAFLHLTLSDLKISQCYTGRAEGEGEHLRLAQYDSSPKLTNTNLDNPLITICTPIVVIPSFLSQFNVSISNIINNARIKINGKQVLLGGVRDEFGFLKGETLVKFLNNTSSGFAQYVLSAYITRESSMFRFLDFDSSNNLYFNWQPVNNVNEKFTDSRVKIAVFYNNVDKDTVYPSPVFVPTSATFDLNTIIFWDYGEAYSAYNDAGDIPDIGLVFIEDSKNQVYQLTLTEKEVTSIQGSNYEDPVLSFNPYSFYSISLLGEIEVPLNKQNYYENNTITFDLSIVATDNFKYKFLPTYTINGKRFKMYSESLVSTLTESLSYYSSRLVDYLIANQSQMKNQFAVNDKEHEYGMITTAVSGLGNIVGGGARTAMFGMGFGIGAVAGATQTVTGLTTEAINWNKDTQVIDMNQKAKLADMGNLPSNLKQVGTDLLTDLNINEMGLYLNHYSIDKVSHDSICRYLERFGYMVNIYDTLQVNSRSGWNYIELNSFDIHTPMNSVEEESIRQIFLNGVTLLHDPQALSDPTGHNIETDLIS